MRAGDTGLVEIDEKGADPACAVRDAAGTREDDGSVGVPPWVG